MRNIRSFNLNSLPMLRELLRHGSVTKAANALHVSQPALSSALKQLREHFEDELVVRRHGGMALTAKGESLLAPLEQALASIETIVLEQSLEDPGVTRRIKIASTDHTMLLIGAPLVRAITEDAPHLKVQFLTVGAQSVTQLMSDTLDMIITPRAMMSTGLADKRAFGDLNSEALLTCRLVCVGRNDDAELAAGLSLDAYLERPHISLALDADRELSIERVALAERSLKQNDVLLTSCYATMLPIVAATGCLAVMPEDMARSAAMTFPIQLCEPPIPFVPMELVMVWHRRNDNDLRLSKLREYLKSCVDIADEAA